VLTLVVIVQLDVKIVLHGVLDKEMYMEQRKWLVQDHNRRFVLQTRGSDCMT